MVNLTDPPTPSASATTDLRITALERQFAALDSRLQLAEEQNLALEDRISGLAAEVARLRRQAFTLKTLNELMLERVGFTAPPAIRPPRPRHLHLAGGSS